MLEKILQFLKDRWNDTEEAALFTANWLDGDY